MEPEQRKLPRLLCFIPTPLTTPLQSQPHPAQATKSQAPTFSASTTQQSPAATPPTNKVSAPNSSHTMKTTNRRKPHQPHVKACQNQRTSVAEARRQRKPVRSISHGVIRVSPARIGLWLPETHDRRCRSSVVGYLETCTSGTLPLWLGAVSPR